LPYFRVFWILSDEDAAPQDGTKPFYDGDHDKATLAVARSLEVMKERLGEAWSDRPNEFLVEYEGGERVRVETWPVYQVSYYMAVYEEEPAEKTTK
jgi:hypothetical protein